MSTRGQSRPLALEQCGYERGYTQIKKKPLKSRQQGRSAPTSKNLTSTAPSMFRNNVTARLTGFTRFPTCTASNPKGDKSHKYGSSNHYYRWTHSNIQSQTGAWTQEKTRKKREYQKIRALSLQTFFRTSNSTRSP